MKTEELKEILDQLPSTHRHMLQAALEHFHDVSQEEYGDNSGQPTKQQQALRDMQRALSS